MMARPARANSPRHRAKMTTAQAKKTARAMSGPAALVVGEVPAAALGRKAGVALAAAGPSDHDLVAAVEDGAVGPLADLDVDHLAGLAPRRRRSA